MGRKDKTPFWNLAGYGEMSDLILLRLGEPSSSNLRHQNKNALRQLCCVLPCSKLAAMDVDGNPAVNPTEYLLRCFDYITVCSGLCR